MNPGRSTQLPLDRYDSDKVAHGYLSQYDLVLEPWLNQPIVLLELGVHTGSSLVLWRDYFPLGTIVGIDIDLSRSIPASGRIHLFEGDQADRTLLSRVASQVAPDGFDIIIDDASHLGEQTKVAFWHLFDHHLKPNGLYVIEDWGTGYWDDWPDGKSLDLGAYACNHSRRHALWKALLRFLRVKRPMLGHNYGIVGFVKQLVDEQAAHDVTRRRRSGTEQRKSKFKNILIAPSIVFIRKA